MKAFQDVRKRRPSTRPTLEWFLEVISERFGIPWTLIDQIGANRYVRIFQSSLNLISDFRLLHDRRRHEGIGLLN